MKKVEAIIRHYKLEAVKDALTRNGVVGMTITEVLGVGAEKGCAITYRGVQSSSNAVPRVKIEIAVADDEADAVIDTIYQNAYTGEVGDGHIFVASLEEVIRIRTGESEGALAHAAAY